MTPHQRMTMRSRLIALEDYLEAMVTYNDAQDWSNLHRICRHASNVLCKIEHVAITAELESRKVKE